MHINSAEEENIGFQFDNIVRNEKLISNGVSMPKAVKTGTTIVGLVYKDGVVLGADTRSTSGDLVADKNCEKIHFIQPNMYCAGAGTAADLDMSTKMMSSQLELHRLNTGRQVQVKTANTMFSQFLFRYQGHVGAALILGGVDKHGPSLYSIAPHGSTSKGPFQVMGSGSLAAMSVIETQWKPNMEMEEAKQLVRDAIRAGIFNDPYSGSNVDLCVINKDGANMLRTYDAANVKGTRVGKYTYKRGTTAVLSSITRPIEIVSETVKKTGDSSESMEVE